MKCNYSVVSIKQDGLSEQAGILSKIVKQAELFLLLEDIFVYQNFSTSMFS
jgi:hypothetical protein